MDSMQRRRRRSVRRVATPAAARFGVPALLAAAGAILVAGCSSTPNAGSSGSPPSGPPRAVVLAAVQRTEALDSAALTLRISISGTPAIGGLGSGSAPTPISFTISGSGAFDFAHKTGKFTLTIPADKQSAGGTLELRLIGSDLYLSAPQLASLDGGKPWIHVDAASYLRKQGKDSGPLGGFADGDPRQVLGMLQQLSGSITQIGTANIDAVPTTEYQGTIDLSHPRPGGATSSTVLSPEMAQAFGLTDLPVDVWIDSEGRARRVQTSFSFFGITVLAQEGLGSFGSPVSVSAPPAGQVADGSSILQSGRLGNLFGNASGSSSNSTIG